MLRSGRKHVLIGSLLWISSMMKDRITTMDKDLARGGVELPVSQGENRDYNLGLSMAR